MSVAYVDTSCLVAIAFREPGGSAMARRLSRFDELVSSSLLEAELRAAFQREKLELPPDLLSAIAWVVPDRPLSAEIARVLEAGYVGGADCFHIATALYAAEAPASLGFLTLDETQSKVAKRLGFLS